MSAPCQLPRLLIVDDLFGRTHPDRLNRERANLCGQFLIEDVTGDETAKGSAQRIRNPIAQAVFFRGQTPVTSVVGNTVENDLEATMRVVRDGWLEWRPERPRWAMILLDLCFYTGRVTEESNRRTLGMPEGRLGDDDPKRFFGLQILGAIVNEFPDLPVVILSSKSRQEVSREFTQRGALFLARSDEHSPERLREYIWQHGLIPDDSGEIVGNSKPLLLALRAARRAAADRRNVLIRGERGTGKELLARYIHRQSGASQNQSYVVVDSGTLSPQLYASELFGHRRGAFTGADRDHQGRILQANGGDLFLDEIGNMPPDVQMGLLRVLEQREVTPLGAREGQKVDVRFLSATNEDLEGRAATGGFRQDLLDRLRQGGTVFLRPLRERLEDLELLVERLVREAERAKPSAMRRQIEPEALELLRSYDWPGNIRELQNCLYKAVSDSPDVEHLFPVHLHFGSSGEASVPRKPERGDLRIESAQHGLTVQDLDALVGVLREFPFEGVKPTDLVGRLPILQESLARFVAGLLKAALLATSRPTPDHPEGAILIHPAIKLLTGDKTLSASKAADIIKRLLSLSPEAEQLRIHDSVLQQAYETAVRLRPRRPQKPRYTVKSA